MLPGPDKVVSCPHCEATASYRTMLSGNTFGARYWSDGRMIAPMLVETPTIAKCPSCGQILWVADARKVDEDGLVKPEVSFDGSPRIKATRVGTSTLATPTESEYYAALSAGFARNVGEERVARMFAWWRRNDGLRGRVRAGPPPLAGEAWRANLEALLCLLDTGDDSDRMSRGEILRQLGRFDEASEELEQVKDDGFAWAAKQVLVHCENRDPGLKELMVER